MTPPPLLLNQNCLDVLGFSHDEKESVYKIVASVMHLGTMKFRQRGREEQAEADGTKVNFSVSFRQGLE